ncbi:hypothetical protein DS745_20855 [Anaerobacillus alkaliphilus]|uniref:Transposase n=1 Tax=Anaerobacillus alkaliphilus TaxID=1548597 RepID=A0A4Q0VN59_9BACI|nr:hypothetical protein [Anaerobacillus alkaliphilus]RXI96195.1 hypothetical protein DS745_20855 [Anaerobacillus alkaliphilus]
MELMTSWEKKGFDQGIEKGIEKGMEKGIEKGLENVTKRMLLEGAPISDILKFTGLTEDQIDRIKQQMK